MNNNTLSPPQGDLLAPQADHTVESLYNRLTPAREPFLIEGRECALYTIPKALPPQGHTAASPLAKPWQSIGALCVTTLASKLLLTMLPPERKPFRMVLDEKFLKEIPDSEKGEWDLALSKYENRVVSSLESRGVRTAAYEAFLQYTIVGNCLLYIGKKKCKVYPLSNYVVERDGAGELVRIIVNEKVGHNALPASVREKAEQKIGKDACTEKSHDMYTHVYQDCESKNWKMEQWVCGFKIEETVTDYGKRKIPWIVLRSSMVAGEDYGRSRVSEYLGDFRACSVLTRSIVCGAAVAAKVIFLRKPGSSTNGKDLQEADIGGLVDGNADDISTLKLDKYPDFQVAMQTLEMIEKRLTFAFLVDSAVQRQAERVTAEEIRTIAKLLTDALGGSYTILNETFLIPLLDADITQQEAEGTLPKLPKNSVRPTAVVGLDALGRNHELGRMMQFASIIAQNFGPEAISKVINLSEFSRRAAAALDIENSGLIATEQEIAQKDAAMQQAAVANNLAPHLIKAATANQSPAASPAGVPAQ